MKNYVTLIGMLILIVFSPKHAVGYENIFILNRNSGFIQTDTLWAKLRSVENNYLALLRRLESGGEEQKIIKPGQYLDSIWYDGIVRWQKAPTDVRRYDWFTWIARHPPRFYSDDVANFPMDGKTAWRTLYLNMRADYLSFVETKPKEQGFRDRLGLDLIELQGDLAIAFEASQLYGQKIVLSEYVTRIKTSIPKMANTDFMLAYLKTLDGILSRAKQFGIDDEAEIKSFLNDLKSVKCPELAAWVAGKERTLALRKIPFEFRYTTYDGKLVDMTQMRGKVVLVDFWATWCSVCIARMPIIKNVYDRYKDKGFEVVSITINKNADLPKVLAIEKRIGADWPLCIIGDSPIQGQIWSEYGFTGIPQLLLFDKKGKLIEDNGLLFLQDSLENLVKEALEK